MRAMAARYHVDRKQASRVARTARKLLKQIGSEWELTMPLAARILDWSARLHEIGLDISHDGYQRHGAYIAENAHMPGFPRAEQRFLAALIGGQRYRIDRSSFDDLPKSWREPALRLLLLLRLAVLLNRSRKKVEHIPIRLRVSGDSLHLSFDADWLARNPLTITDLELEQEFLAEVGYSLLIEK